MEESGDSNIGFLVAQLNQEDIPGVIQLELEGGLNSLGRAGFERQLARPGSILLVAKDSGQLMLGSLSGWVIADEFQIDNIVVRDSARRRGIGSSLLWHGARLAANRGAEKAVLEVRSANLAARRLYEKYGFELVGQRHEYYRDPTDDALIMICKGRDWDSLVA